MRGGVLLGVGVVLMVVALCFAVAVGVYATRHAEQVAKTPPSVPAEPPPPEPVEKLKYKRNAPIPKQTSVEVPKSSVPKEPPPAPATNLPQPDPIFQPTPELVGDLPAANTATLVSVQTCDGGTLQLNVAEKQMFDLHNRTRTQRGLTPLCVSPYLTQLARVRSQDMMNRDYFSHYAPPDGMTVIDQIERSGNPENYGALGENISRGGDGTDTDTPAFMFDGLMHSPGHRANILHEEFSEIGVGALSGKYKPTTTPQRYTRWYSGAVTRSAYPGPVLPCHFFVLSKLRLSSISSPTISRPPIYSHPFLGFAWKLFGQWARMARRVYVTALARS